MNILTNILFVIAFIECHSTTHKKLYHKETYRAYVITTNKNDARASHTKKLLEDLSFQVDFVVGAFKLNMTRDMKIASIRNATREALIAVATGTDKFAYIFEDDIGLAPNEEGRHVTAADIRLFHSEWIKSNYLPGAVYVGVCLQWIKNNGNCPNISLPDPHPPRTAYHCCGTCHHAIAYSRSGAQQLLEIIKDHEPNIIPVDRLLFNWCRRAQGEFWVRGWNHRSLNQITHRGWFFQDRNRHKTVKDRNNNSTTVSQ